MTYVIKAPAKINIGLDVIRKRSDGYHDLKMIMQTIDIYDTLIIETEAGSCPCVDNTGMNDSEACHSEAYHSYACRKKAEQFNDMEIEFTCSEPSLSAPENNLVVKAIRLLADEFNIHDHIKIRLEKKIPVAAGMAGGSSDAAAAFIAMNDIYDLGLTKEELMKRAVKLGADIPYCIMKGTALCEGIGDIITPIRPFTNNVEILIVKPPIEVSTGFVYGNLKITEETVHPDIDAIIELIELYNNIETKSCDKTARSTETKEDIIANIGHLLGNVLEDVTIPAYPIIKDIKETMVSLGACGALMSGSGPTVFGIFFDNQVPENRRTDEEKTGILEKTRRAAGYFRKNMPEAFVAVARACDI